jgi:uncharacterized protein (TIGR02001 family)
MKKTLALLALFAGTTLPLAATASFEIGWVSRYVWRGFDLYADNHQALQPCLALEFADSGFSLELWSSFALTGSDEYGSSGEVDLTLSYDFMLNEKIALNAGLIHYGYYFAKAFSARKDTTLEAFLSVELPEAFLSPSLSLYYDFNLGSGCYLQLECRHRVPLGKSLDLELAASLGYNGKLFIAASGFSDFSWQLAVPLRLGAASLTPHIDGSVVFLKEVNDHNEWWAGLTLAW